MTTVTDLPGRFIVRTCVNKSRQTVIAHEVKTDPLCLFGSRPKTLALFIMSHDVTGLTV
jgi:hypothetical protein